MKLEAALEEVMSDKITFVEDVIAINLAFKLSQQIEVAKVRETMKFCKSQRN